MKDPGTIQILKDYMANGRFSLGTEVIAPASLAFIGNIDDSISEIVRSAKHDLFKPLPVEFDLAVIHRFHLYLPGWEIPSNADNLLTSQYGFITDYMAEAFHHLFKHRTYFSLVKKRARLSAGFQGRDEAAVYKTVAGFIKLLHPDGECSDDEFEHYLAYAIEGRRRVKEQLNKRKADDEFAEIHLGYTNTLGEAIEVHCPESAGVEATLSPRKQQAPQALQKAPSAPAASPPVRQPVAIADTGTTAAVPVTAPAELKPKEFTIRYGDTGFSYRSIFGDYLKGAKKLVIEDPHVRRESQIQDLLQLCELAVEIGTIAEIQLITHAENPAQQAEGEKPAQQTEQGKRNSVPP